MTKKSCCTSFDHFGVTNSLVPLIALPASCGANAGANGHVTPHNNCVDITNAIVPLMTLLGNMFAKQGVEKCS